MEILVVGAGFAGAVIARELVDAGDFRVTVIDRRDHIAGNAYDPVHAQSGRRYHKYGPHIFHTNSKPVFDYLSRFTKWLDYRHRVKAILPTGRAVPMPINRETLNIYHGQDLPDEAAVRKYLDSVRQPDDAPDSAEAHLLSLYGRELTELFFGNYTEKMWDLTLREMPVSVVARLPVRYDDDPYYFQDEYQCMPANGYIALFENLLDHSNIEVRLATEFDHAMEGDYDHVFNSMPIDEYFDNAYGPLPYRSIRFDHRFDEAYEFDVPTVNFTDRGVHTRKTCWALYPGCGGNPGEHVTYESPCSYEDNNFERYYPIKTVDGWPQARYRQYAELAAARDNITFIGRCGQYIYYDMHQVVANSRSIAAKFLEQIQ